MKIAVMGKGGSGKTTISGVLSRVLAQQGSRVLAVDADTNPNLGVSLGLGADKTFELIAARQALDDNPKAKHAKTMEEVIRRFGADAPDGVRVVQVTKVEAPAPGCQWCGLSPEQLLRELEKQAGRVVVADFEAGVGTMSRTDAKLIDCAVVVVEPYMKSIETGRRLVEMIRSNGGNRIVVVANKIRDDEDLTFLRSKLDGIEIDVVVPEDKEVAEADLKAESPIDRNPNSPAVEAIRDLATYISGVPTAA